MFDCWMSLDLNYVTRLAQGARTGHHHQPGCQNTPTNATMSRATCQRCPETSQLRTRRCPVS
jgi:hypothetical protein